ncbi:MAG: prolipoprotein diacylglyceryl transferase family protein, partial [Pseudomonadota bacterium]
ADMTNRGLLWLAAAETPPLVPVQLMEAGLEMALAVLLTHLYSRRSGRGRIAGLYFIAYGIFRFVIEYYRFDPFRGDLLIFSTSQWISLLLILVGAALLGSRRLRAVLGKT